MQRFFAALLASLLAASPSVTTVLAVAAASGMPCCKSEMTAGHCHQPASRVSCCEPDQPTPPAAPATATAVAPAAAPDQSAPVLLSEGPGPVAALVASRSFAAWSGSITGPPPHLVLGVFRI
ncbi:MAG: hypothetical protein AB7O67_13845 [Vicinamibacterales bacterium]